MTELQTQEGAFGALTVFRVAAGASVPRLVDSLPRRERWVLLLVDGRRTLADLARLTRRSQPETAYTLARFLQRGYIEQVNPVASPFGGLGRT